jgi:hypothetical protein
MLEYCRGKILPGTCRPADLTYRILDNKIHISKPLPDDRDSKGMTEKPVAQLRFNRHAGTWSLYFLGYDDAWQLYDLIKPATCFEELLAAMDEDRMGIFWK